MFDEDHWAEVPLVIDRIQSLTGIAEGDSVLDTCCGVGRHSLELAARGYRVTGVDITDSCIEAARESARDFGLDIEFVQDDVRHFTRDGHYDLCLNLFTSFGYFPDPAEDLATLVNFRRSLAPGGTFVLEMNGKETAARDYIEGEWFERLGWTVLTEFEPVDDWGGLRTRWVLIRGAERVDRTFVQRLYAGTEMRSLFGQAGFKDIRILGSLDGSPYNHKATSLVAIGRV